MLKLSTAGAVLTSGLLLFLVSCSKSQKAEARVSPEASLHVPVVAVAAAAFEDMRHDLVLTAEFRPFQEIEVMAKVAGYIKSINVDAGDRIKEGQLIATLEVPEMANEMTRARATVQRSAAEVARARDEVARAESAHQIAHLSYQRLAAVVASRPGLLAQQEVDDAHGRDLVAEAQLASAKSALAVTEQQVDMSKADEDKSKILFAYTKVVAPFSGVVTKRYANTGSMIQAGTASQAMPLIRLSQNSMLRLILPVPESVVSSVRIGQVVEVRVPSLQRVFPGKVARFSGRVQSSTRTMETEVDVPNSSLVLIPGMYAEVNLTLERRGSVLAVPTQAVEGEGKGAKVYVVTQNGVIEVRPVNVGLETATRVEIKSGLKEDEMVVIGNRSGLKTGQRVAPKVTVIGREKGKE